MPLPSLYITRLLPAPIMEAIRTRYALVSEPREGDIPTAEAMRRGFADADAVICTLADPITDELFAAAPRLKIVANYAVGYNNIDVATATRRGIVVTNTPEVLTDATADLVWALMLAVARRVVEGDRWVRTGQWPGWAPTQMLGTEVAGKTLGIIGMGRIGQAVARRASGFDMPVLYASRHKLPHSALYTGWTRASIRQVFERSDFLSLHVPLTESTRHLIGAKELALMKPGAILINTARGPVVDEAALLAALQQGTIAGAGLDVYEREPTLQAGLEQLPNVVLLPHLGSATQDTRIKMGLICLENIAAVLSGCAPINPVH
ncbi:MAG: D-glycerate dehydrogenase [Nitrospira sp.]|jgi:glyoxylate reductase|nr:D-glycerate dehydrogenase [Nitrospira sp.]